MTKQEKEALVAEITAKLQEKPNVYIANTGGLTVEKVNALRRKCFESGVEMQVVKNTLLRKAFEASGRDYSGVFPALKEHSAVFFVQGEDIKAPAKVLSDFRGKDEVPSLKGAYIDASVFLGDAALDQLKNLKSKQELIGEIVGLLQSPARNVISALQSGGSKLAGIVKTLEEKAQ